MPLALAACAGTPDGAALAARAGAYSDSRRLGHAGGSGSTGTSPYRARQRRTRHRRQRCLAPRQNLPPPLVLSPADPGTLLAELLDPRDTGRRCPTPVPGSPRAPHSLAALVAY